MNDVGQSLQDLFRFRGIDRALFSDLRHLLLLTYRFEEREGVVQLLFPFPRRAPVPRIAVERPVVNERLLIKDNAGVRFLFQGGRAIGGSASLPLQNGRPVNCSLLVFLITLRVLGESPTDPPAYYLRAVERPVESFSLLVRGLGAGEVLL